jgi:DivIVA domain-containing protein
VTLVLLYLVVLILVAVVLFGIGSVLFGRGERLPPLPRATTATVLPASGVVGADVEAVKFTQVLRGYKTSEVDWVLDRLGQELDSLRGELSTLRGVAAGELDEPAEPDGSAYGHPGQSEGAHAMPSEPAGEAAQ